MHEAKTNLSKLVAAINSGREQEVVIAINGKPAARLVPVAARQAIRWGLLKGKVAIPDDIDRDNAEIACLFNGDGD